jgi:NADH:ubiquinone oxidoreductase subunit F (NADH-binding)/NADH:ubiquinone oxidoreductase subunit E/Pyruvate/2-oxoacid:ferredoxin oxidoreductase delta subunit
VAHGPESAIPLLQAIQREHGYLPPEVLRQAAERAGIPLARLAGVATFYPQFRHRPVGRHVIRVCDGTACHVKGSEILRETLRRHLQLEGAADTDARGEFTVETVACLGCCTLAPVIQVDEVTYGHLTPDRVPAVLEEFLRTRAQRAAVKTGTRAPAATGGEVRVGQGSCCMAKGSRDVHDAVARTLAAMGVDVRIKRVGCVGMCSQAPLLEIATPGGHTALYARVQAPDVPSILDRHFRARGARAIRLAASRWMGTLLAGPAAPQAEEIERTRGSAAPFFEPQVHIATAESGALDPLDLGEYRGCGGFEALQRCVTSLDADTVIGEIRQSGLRGRGGAGFPTGVKWAKVKEAAGAAKVIVCNGDEGDPGAFMDRMIMESYPYRVIEGMAIASYAVGAREGVLYIRSEYPLALERIRAALARCEQEGLIGPGAAAGGFPVTLTVFEGAGAFVCGEETALLASVEGRRGMPRLRPPYPGERGLRGLPTLVNNVETFALVPWIVRHGGEAFAKLGTAESKGTKVFALAGKVERGGLIEVPMGLTLRQIVEQMGGGIAGGRRFKAVQIGGPSGGCIPERLADTPVDYHSLAELGAIMGSGGIVVLDDGDCMVELARYFVEFTQGQSCGRCTFCRIGTRRMLEILDRLCAGRGSAEDIGELEQLAHQVQVGSLCGLGKTAPNPVLTTLKYFREEYEAHVKGHCPSGRCRGLIRYTIGEKCIGCTLCAQHCPVDAIPLAPYQRHEIDQGKCIRCGTCKQVCPAEAVGVE